MVIWEGCPIIEGTLIISGASGSFPKISVEYFSYRLWTSLLFSDSNVSKFRLYIRRDLSLLNVASSGTSDKLLNSDK